MKFALLFLMAASATAAPVLNSVEFPFASFPHELWDRELVWMKNVGIQNVELQVRDPSQEAELIGILRTLRKLDLTAWVRLDLQAASLAPSLEPLRQSHGGPVAYLNADVPQPVTRVSAISPTALFTTRSTLIGQRGTILWTDVEDTLRPEFHRGAISFLGEELPAISAIRRDAVLVRYWESGLANLSTVKNVRSATGSLPEGVIARQSLTATDSGASAVSIANTSKVPFHGDLRVFYPPAKHEMVLPGVQVPAAESLWLPVNIPLTAGPFCKNCEGLGNADSIVYATAELVDVEYENGILAMEFAAPAAGEVLVHLSQEPSGPYLAGGKPRTFDWDQSTSRVRLPVPAGRGAGSRVRVSLALAPPDNAAFFEDAKVLIIGQNNILTTTYSSPDIAQRSRVRAPKDLKLEPIPKGPLQIDYEVSVPPDALHGDHRELTLEADGNQMGHARVQLLRAASLKVREAASRHFGTTADLPFYPALVSLDQRAGREINITIHNNFPEIKNFILQLSGDDLEFSPAKTDISIGAGSERDITIRVFPKEASTGLHEAHAKLTGAAIVEIPILFAVIPRGETISYATDGVSILESAKARVVFADQTQRRWLEFTWKDSDRNVLPDTGIDLGPGTRKIQLKDAELTIDQPMHDQATAPTQLKPGKRGDITLQITHNTYTLSR